MLMTKLSLLGTHAWLCLKFLLWEFSGGPVVETECSHCHGPCSISGCVTKIPQITQLCPREKNGGSERKKHLWSVAAAPEWAFFLTGSTCFWQSAWNVGDMGSIPGLGRSPGEEIGNPLQYSYLENPMDREAWQVTVHGLTKHQTWLSN